MPAVDPHAPVLGPPGEPCAACGAPLAGDQRYCLNCGERRGPPRLDPLAHARGPAHVRAGANSAPRPAAPWPLPTPRVAGVAALLVLGFGIVAGAMAGSNGPTPASAIPRRMIVVAAPPTQPAPTTAATPTQPATTDTSTPDTATSDGSSTDTSAPAASTSDSSAPDTSTSDSSSPDTSSPDTSTTGKDNTPSTDDSSDTSTSTEPTVKHVWIVALTGHTMDEALADPSPMPYLSETLRPKGLLLSGYKPALPGGLANLIALVSGQRPTAEQRGGCPAYNDVDPKARTGCVFAKDIETLPGQLAADGKTWRAYVEDSDAGQPPDTCRHPAPGGALEQVMTRNPYLFFHAIVDTPDCAANTAGTSRLIPDTEDADSAPTLSLVLPNACHDGADQMCAPGAPAGLGAADAWLEEQLEPLLASKAYKDDGMVVITFDTGPDPTKPLGALVISDTVDAGATDDGDYRPANLLRTFEDLFSLDPLGRAKDVHAVSITKPSR